MMSTFLHIICLICTATPGRLAHLLRDFKMDFSQVNLFVFDEADKLLEASFIPDIDTIYNSIPTTSQVIAVSATYLNAMDDYVLRFMKTPAEVRVDEKVTVRKF